MASRGETREYETKSNAYNVNCETRHAALFGFYLFHFKILFRFNYASFRDAVSLRQRLPRRFAPRNDITGGLYWKNRTLILIEND